MVMCVQIGDLKEQLDACNAAGVARGPGGVAGGGNSYMNAGGQSYQVDN